MMKVKDGYKKLIGTSYSGSANNLLLSNGGDIPLTSLFTALTNDNNQISITVGGTNKKLTVAYATKASLDANGNVITSTYATKNELNATKYWANVPISATASNTTKPTLHPDFAFNVAANTIIAGGSNKAIASPLAKYLWHDILSFGVNSWPTVYVSSDGGSTWSTSTDINLLKKLFILRDDQTVTVLDNTKTAIRWVWNSSLFHACQAAYLNIGFAYSASLARFNIVWDVSTDGTTWSTGFSTNNVAYTSSPYWFYVNNTWSNIKYARLTLTRTSAAGTSANLSAIKLLSYRWGNQGRGGEYEYPYNWDASLNIYPRVSNSSSLGTSSNKWSSVYATTFTGNLEGNAKTATSANSAKSDAAGNEISTTYAPLASPTFTGTPKAPTAAAGTNTTQIATTAFVNNAVGAGFAANDAMLFKGTIGTGGTVTALPNTHSIGWTYRVITAGTYAGQSCEIGDLIICIADGTAANNAHWAVAQGNISNMSTVVAGPSSATSGNIAVFDGTTGKKIKDGGAKISDFLTKTTYEWNKEIAFGSTGKLCIGKFVMYDSAVIVTISATTNLTYHGVLVIATLNHGTASGGSIKATVYGDASNTIAPNIYIYSHPANDGLVEVYFSPTSYSKNLIHIQAQSLAQRGTVSYTNLAFDICTSITAIPDTATLKPTNALTETFMGKSAVSVSNLLSSGNKIGTITINGTAKDIFQTPLTWNNIANKPTSFTPSTHTHDYAPYQSWTASVKGVTWSRLCYVKVGNSTVGSKFILNIAATRNSVVYNDTYIITAHHSQNGKIAKIGGCNYSAGYKIRINTDSTGNCYVELYDNCNSATASISQSVYCRLLSLFTGEVTKYTTFTDGTTLASGFETVTTLTTTNEDFQGTVSASRLTTTSKTAWGLTYWTSNGVPTSISGNMTGVGSISMSNALTLTGTTAETAQIKFSRPSYNYITFPSTGYLALATAANGSSIVAAVDSSSISPYENNKGSLGKADKVWNAIYATTFVGNVSGNVSGSAGSVAWGNVTGKPSSFTPSSHTHYSLVTEGDKRNDNTTPDVYKNSLIFRGLKYNNKINSPASSTYSYLLGLRGWSDKSGGGAHELAFNDVGIQRRNSTSTSDAWGTWKTLLDSENFTTFVTTDAIGAAPSVHTHAYLPTAGGTMTGTITMNTGTGIAMKYTGNGSDVWMYPNGAPSYGIRYFEGDVDAMAFSATNNNTTKTGADLCINGNGAGTVTIRGKNIWHAGNSGQVKWCDFWSTNSTATTSNNISGATITTDCNEMVENGHWYYKSNGPTTALGATTNDGALYSQGYSTSWVAQIAQDYRNGNLFTRGKNSGTWTAWKKVAHTNDIPTKVSQLTNDSGFVTGGPYLPLSGGSLNNSAKLKLQLYGARTLTLSGNSIDLDMSLDTGTYAGAFATIKDSKLAVTTMLGFYGSHGNGLYHIFMGGSYNDPAMKMDPSGNFTFKNTISGTITNANAAGTALRLTSPYAYEDSSLLNVITNNTTADSLFSDSYSFSAMMSNHPLWSNYATVWNFSGYLKYGGTQFAVMYNTQPVRAAIRTFTQTGSKWGDWVELLTTANYTTHITLAGLGIEAWATNKGFATESYVTNKVTEIITGGTITLDGYATTEYVNNTFLPKANLSVSGGGSTWQSSLTITLNGTATTLTLPANPNTDSKVLLVVTTTANTSWRPLLLGASYSDSTPSTFSTTTNNIYASHIMRVQPSTGSIETTGTITASSFIGTATHATNAFYIKTLYQLNTSFYAGHRAWFKWINGSTLGLKIAKDDSETDTTISTYKFKADLAYSADTAGWADGADSAVVAEGDINGNPIHSTYLKLSGGTLTGGVTMAALNTSDVMYYANATNKGYNIGFGVGTSGNRGVYDAQAGGWILKIDSSHKVTFSGTAACADKINVTATSMREAFYIPFVDALSGSRTVNVNGGLCYDPGTNTLTATTFDGNATSATTASTATSATTASKLSTVSKTAWGQTYWTTGGVPTNITGDITGKYFLIKDVALAPYLKLTTSNSKTALFYLNDAGNILIGPTTSTSVQISATGVVTLPSTLTVTSNITSSGTISATGGVFETSDARLKYFIKDIEVDFTRLKEIPKKYFIWKNDKQQTVQIGTSAQNLKKIYPELVLENSSGELSVSYNKLSIVALKGIDELYNLIVKLQEENKELRQLITNLNKK